MSGSLLDGRRDPRHAVIVEPVGLLVRSHGGRPAPDLAYRNTPMPTESPNMDQRRVVPHVDDLGASHGANQAFLDLAHRGLVTAEAELRAQIERAIATGLKPTHIDAHMAAAMLPDLLGAHVRLGQAFGLFPVLPRSIVWAPDPVCYRKTIAALDDAGAPVVDHCRGTLAVASERLEAGWRDVVAELPPGTTHLALHCTLPGDFAAMAPAHAGWRQDEYALLGRGFLRDLCQEHAVDVTSTRVLQGQWLRHLNPSD